MNNEYTEKIVDAQTGEETFREYTAEEIAAVEAAKVEIQNQIAILEAKEAAKESAQSKLAALGLTVEDLQALGI